jgi:hypothetical protein
MPLVSRKAILAIACRRCGPQRAEPASLGPRAGGAAQAAQAAAAPSRAGAAALVREGILKGIRGPHGGYELGRERKHISAEDIVRAAGETQDGPTQGRRWR